MLGLTFKAGKKAYNVEIKIEFGFWAYVGLLICSMDYGCQYKPAVKMVEVQTNARLSRKCHSNTGTIYKYQYTILSILR